MSKKPHTAEPSAVGTAVPENIPAHKHAMVTREGGSHVVSAPETATVNETTEASSHVKKP